MLKMLKTHHLVFKTMLTQKRSFVNSGLKNMCMGIIKTPMQILGGIIYMLKKILALTVASLLLLPMLFAFILYMYMKNFSTNFKCFI